MTEPRDADLAADCLRFQAEIAGLKAKIAALEAQPKVLAVKETVAERRTAWQCPSGSTLVASVSFDVPGELLLALPITVTITEREVKG